ncbi:PGF-pre-PGF domain-containing protein [Methanosarcina hadiensis]|uniref:PGF-pre-PGF domain-containing protein n=1 Tax=Methanosarcina hadiensis TaxID=3078083 RepID=UPI0039776D17
MKYKTLFIVFTLIFLMGVPSTVSARDIIVGSGSGQISTIQEAVDAAEAGDVIIIKPGTYVENINVSKERLTIKPETNNVFIKPGNGTLATIILSNVGTTLTDLNIHGDVIANIWASDRNSEYQINNPTYIKNNVIENGSIAVRSESSGVIISENRISGGTSEYGVDVACCGDYNEITNNEISNCTTGIYVYDERNVPPISGNKISNCDVGIHVSGLSYDIENNEITNCGVGVLAGETGGANLIGNKITYCSDCGLKVTGYLESKGAYNNYFNNTVNIKFGDIENIYTWNSSLIEGTNIIGGPYIGGNYWAKPDGTGFSQIAVDANGDGIADSAYAISEKNYDYLPLTAVYNPVLPVFDFTANVTSGTAPLVVLFTASGTGGSSASWLWDFGDGINSKHAMNATHTFTDPGSYKVSLTVENSAGNSTVVKTNYIVVTGSDVVVPGVPIAGFSSNVTEGYAPLAVQFYDSSRNAVSRAWDFENDGKIDSSDPNPVHVYKDPGTYFVNLSITNEYGFSYSITTINVMKGDPGDDDNSRSHSSGGGGGSPEPAKNIEVKELCQVFITNGKETKFDFTKNATCVVYASFDAKKTAGKTTTIAEELKDKSALVSELPEGEVYKSFNVWVGNSGYATPKNIENSEVCFRVEKSWVQEKSIDQDSITLNTYRDKKWEQLPVILSEEDDKFLYFTAETPGFSSFAITGKAKSTDGAETGENLGSQARAADQTGDEAEGLEAESGTVPQESVSAPGFAVIYGLAGLLAVFLYRRK